MKTYSRAVPWTSSTVPSSFNSIRDAKRSLGEPDNFLLKSIFWFSRSIETAACSSRQRNGRFAHAIHPMIFLKYGTVLSALDSKMRWMIRWYLITLF